ncbi:PadR family transcriptional regulator [Spelaeicoccus albus]|uniref:DNA-binding PadR family transcriptional regulator n=1 Tax=Spelaeicoccus albus TaxID=1280376 RepID=A0A7Z0D206_9MICO|nr:PadR family transcriptional regulator [Spelaeicoccus albus]NYI67377.1 DNA-binding PadR family transcriptional regulator [Spelaeicoccus albus]
MPPVFAHGALRLYLLALLSDGPKHGYELIGELSDRFGGTYKPSAGTIYPRLAKLQEEGLVETEQAGRRTVYRITDAGQAEVDARRDDLESVEDGIAESVKRMADDIRTDISATMRSMRADMAAAAQSARSSATTAWATGGDADRTPSGNRLRQLKEAEAQFTAFRNDMRAELRTHAARTGLDDLTVETIKTVLSQAKASIVATLKD